MHMIPQVSLCLHVCSCSYGSFLLPTQSVGGNVCNASPISDLNPVLMACGAKLNLASKGEE